MRLLSDPQPAIEWFCTGGSVCIGVEGEDSRELDVPAEPRPHAAAKAEPPRRFPVARGDA